MTDIFTKESGWKYRADLVGGGGGSDLVVAHRTHERVPQLHLGWGSGLRVGGPFLSIRCIKLYRATSLIRNGTPP